MGYFPETQISQIDNFPIFDDANDPATKTDLYMLVHIDSVTDTNNQ